MVTIVNYTEFKTSSLLGVGNVFNVISRQKMEREISPSETGANRRLRGCRSF